ncbi:MAG TPA: imidazole glycerol phosphate synthase subunit HisH [Candidatus Binatia bacterium]|nr:imidazole glycerol phosphate synthase subunit HisH [Candidatus Binatia bacterium]
MRPIAIIDYGMGNLRSVQKALEKVGAAAEVTRDAARIETAPAVVLPGVGAFGACMDNLRTYGLVDPIKTVIARGTPFLGICLGMQLLFEESEEFGPVRGLGIFPGRVVRFRIASDLKVPHMGWNQIRKTQNVPHLDGIADGAFVYFVHSYYVQPADPALTATTTEYGIQFASAIARDNVFASQYHPEKSQAIGQGILRNFARLVADDR